MYIEESIIRRGKKREDDRKSDELPIDGKIEKSRGKNSDESKCNIDINENIYELPATKKKSGTETNRDEDEEKWDVSGRVPDSGECL